ncbi:diguanylate cyclase [Duganella sp. FT135W]|uniref:diguanylate cyclase n=1 Tax=Duganella flavida TaxID=2692175 RepID=A0A6L8KHI1_9BURK|nr:GGDEF domain-containing protein [Duganella flavida]MYM25274.1 diguanylate cyclase [Duganella flavida]
MPPWDYRFVALSLRRFWRGMLLCAVLVAPAQAALAAERKVLILYSLGSDASSAWQTLLRKGMSAELARQDVTTLPNVFEERFDAVRIGDIAAVAAMEPYLRSKYAGVKFDAIITENYTAARFLSERPDLFPGVPRHYVNHSRLAWAPADGIAYQIEADYALTIGIIPRVAPNVKRVVVIGDSTERIQESVRAVRTAARAHEGKLAFEYWEHQSYDEMYRAVAQLDEGSAIFLLPTYHDRTGERRRPVDTVRKLVSIARVPIFTNWEAIVVPGVVGGYVVSAERIGGAIADILLQRQPDIAGIPGYIFDYGAVQRYHLQNIPPAAQYLNRPQSVLQQYLWQIVAGLTLIVLEGILISALVVSLRSRRQTLCALNEERDQLEARVTQRTLELMVANTKLEQQATTDPLTGIGNRRRMTEQINKELERSRRFKHPLSLLMADIDHFKHVNDIHGHEAGDRTLVMVAHALASGMRSIDMASRFGGEEFVLLMPETEIDVARAAAERLRTDIAALRIQGDNGDEIQLTISIGVSCSDPTGAMDSASSLISRADKALYQAKHQGRDRVICY